ncbi:MAG: DUF4159 domain-containing protein [Sandaracinus sp.]|nr:DUF4159 domain-containing protein [Sandaracinus sp.]
MGALRVVALVGASVLACLAFALPAAALGESTRVAILGVDLSDVNEARPLARRRLAWEVRKRTSIETVLQPGRARLDDPRLFESPFLHWTGDRAFAPLSEAESTGLRRFVEFGGFVLVDDARPEDPGFDTSIRRELRRALGASLRPIARDHTIFRSFYLVDRPFGRVWGPDTVEGLELGGRLAVVYTRHDLGGALARDNLGNWVHPVTPGGDDQRERAIRFGVNLVMYALCLDYKDDQVHAPFIMRRRGAGPRP